MMEWWTTLIVGGIPLLAWLVFYWNDIWYSTLLKLRSGGGGGMKLPPGHMGHPVIGETLSFLWYFKVLGSPDDFIISKKLRYGEGVGMYRSHFFGSPAIISCSPASNRYVLQREGGDFSMTWPNPEFVGRTSIFNVHGSQHAFLRSFIAGAINRPAALRRIALSVQPRLVATLRSWSQKETIVADLETKKMIFANICKMFVGMEPGPMTETMEECFNGLIAAGSRAYPIDLPGFAYHRAIQCRRKVAKIFKEEVEKRRRAPEGGPEADLMAGLMTIKGDNGEKLSDDEVVDNIITLTIAGYSTTAVAAMWALYHLAKSPSVLQKLREENLKLSGERKGLEFITMDDVPKLKYTASVVEEALRMANVLHFLLRRVNRNVDYGGYRLPKGWLMLVWIRSIHMDPNYFEDPLTFNPDRWTKAAKPGTFQVFGSGPRICPGNMLARMQLAIFLHHLSVNYKWSLVNPDAKIEWLPRPRPSDGAQMLFQAL